MVLKCETNLNQRRHELRREDQRTVSQFVTALKLCIKTRDMETGRKLHQDAAAVNVHTNKYVATILIQMYTKCRSVAFAKEVFDSLLERDTVVWNSLILGYVENGKHEQAISLFTTMDCEPNCVTFVAALKAYGSIASESEAERMFYLERAIEIHTRLKELGLTSDVLLATTLIWTYTKCGSMERAQEVFDTMSHRDVAAWNSLMLGYIENGASRYALKLFSRMDCTPTSVSYVAVLKACGRLAIERESEKESCLRTGMAVHKQIITHGSDIVVATTLLDMYTKCGSMKNAREVFDGLPQKNVVAWTSLITGYVRNGESLMALDLFASMGCQPGPATYIAALKACGNLVAQGMEKRFCLERGINLHKQVSHLGFEREILVSNSLIHMYSRCGSMKRARDVFEKMRRRDVVSWNSLLLGYVENGDSMTAVVLFGNMDSEPNSVTYIIVLKAHERLSRDESEKEFLFGKVIRIHQELQERGVDSIAPVASALIDAYSSFGCMQRAKQVFNRMKLGDRDVVCWNSLLLGYVENGEALVAMDLLTSLDCEPSSVTYTAALKACGKLASRDKELSLQNGLAIHKHVQDSDFQLDAALANSLIVMYSKCGCMQRAEEVFQRLEHRNVAAWTSLILGYVENEEFLVALDLFSRMECEPSSVTYVAVLKACASLASSRASESLEKGVAIHEEIRRRGMETELYVANALISMYTKLGSLDRARDAFQRMKRPDTVSWNSLLMGYVEHGQYLLVVELFSCMDCEPCPLTYVAVVKAYGELAREPKLESLFCLEKVIGIHKQLKERGFDGETVLENSLVDFYSKCQSMQHARTVFDAMTQRNVVTWSCLVLGYVANGEFQVALECFTTMDCAPSSVTCIAALKACGGLGALGVGQRVHAVACQLGLEQEVMVVNALMAFYVKCGDFDRAGELLRGMQSPNIVSWNTVIAGYSSLGDLNRTLHLAKEMQENGFQMDCVTLTCILTACNHSGLVEESQVCFDSISAGGLGSSVKHFNCMVDVLGRANKLDEALSLISSMPFKPTSVTWMTLLAACSKWKNLEVGRVAFEALVSIQAGI